jgi:hypothetical protein
LPGIYAIIRPFQINLFAEDRKMKSVTLSNRNKCHSGGFLLILVIVTLAIGLLILGVSMYSMDPFAAFHGSGADRYADPNAAPWQEGHLFINPALDAYHMGGKREPFPVQPKLEGTTYYDALLTKDGEERGTINVRFSPDGDVAAVWEGKFKLNDVEYEVLNEETGTYVTSVFKGNIAPLKVYEDENGKKHYRKLYFITSGYAVAAAQNGERIEGTGYVTGWMNKDHTCFGKLWIVSAGGESPAVYEWEAVEPTEK